MGQYWKPVNLDKKEYLNPHKLGCGAKLWEQLANPGVGQALVILLSAMPGPRGGGDLNRDPIIGRWAGDRVVFVGDYAEDTDFQTNEGDPVFSDLYGCCREDGEPQQFTDITDQVCAVIERELRGKFVGDGWRDFVKEN